MRNLQEFYTAKVEDIEKEINALDQQLLLFSILRLFVFLGIGLASYFASVQAHYVFGVLLVGVPLFLYLVSTYSDLRNHKAKKDALKNINVIELQVLQRNYGSLANGEEFSDDAHYFGQDVDLFGEGSFFQVSNRTQLPEGAQLLADMYKANAIDEIQLKQAAIQEIGEKVDWRQEFSAMAALAKTEVSNQFIGQWLKAYKPFVPKAMKILPMVFSILSLGVFVLYFYNFIPEAVLITWWVAGMVIVGVFSKKVTRLGHEASKLKSTFDQYNQLLALIENTPFASELIRRQKTHILSQGESNSKVLKKFAKLLGNLDRNGNLIYLIFANGFFLRSLTDCYAIERWITTHGKDVEAWFKTIAFFDAYNSLGNFAFNHPAFNYPQITDNDLVLHSEKAGHPLLDPTKSILNDITIDGGQFFIITGANMAGKSTFLRTVSLQIMMANVGMPVCASRVSYTPIKLITSMRTTDSLTEDESYFFSELKRLRFIVDALRTDRYFIVLDEILKGTNSTDKAIGSRKFLERLVASKATGIIATHDLSLCEVAKEHPSVKNHYFDAEIVENELHFDYTFKKGICQNMNASFLLKKMGIIE